MSFSDAVSEMLTHLDGVITTLPLPVGNANQLPDDVVVLRSIEKKKSGIGTISEENSVSNKVIEQGLFSANVDTVLWSKESQNVVERSRAFMTSIFNMNSTATTNGLFKSLDLGNSQGPDYYDDGKLWRISIGVNLTFEYRFEEVPGTGIISEIPVSMEGELEEDFIVS